MKLATISRAAVITAAMLLSVGVTAQTSGRTGLDIPESTRFVGKEANVRKATAIVNGEVITETDIDHRLALILASNQVELPPEEIERVRAQVLRNLIDETLQVQAAEQADIKVTPAEVDRYFERVASNFKRTPEAFTAYLREVGSSERSLKRQIKGEIAWSRLQSSRIEPFVNVGDQEVQQILDRLDASRGTSEYRVAEIFLSATPETAAEAKANADRIVDQIRKGASFPAYARQFSEASTAAVGGELGWVRAEQLPPELAGHVQGMPVGAVTDPIPVPGGFSIVLLADSRKILTSDPRDAQLSLMQMSIALPPGTTQQQAQPKIELLQQTTQSMGGCGRAADAAKQIGAELVSNDQVRVRDLPAPLQQALIDLGVGQATPPFGSLEKVSVLVLCGRDDPEPATGPTYEQVYAQLNEQRVNRRAQRYLRDLRRDAVVDYR